jgi:glycosyltransferase involved in cell wall biosynthesis
MRVAFNARVLGDPVLRGWNRYTLNLASGLVDLGIEVYLYSDRAYDAAQLAQLPTSSMTIKQSPPMNYLRWEQQWVPQQCATDRIDVFHSPIHFGLPQWTRTRCVLTIHDAIEETYYAVHRKTSISQRITRMLCWMARHRADHIVTVSEHSRRELIRLFKLSEDRVSVTYEAADHRFHQTISSEARERVRLKYQLPEQFVLYVGSFEPRKNLPFLLRACAIAQLRDLHVVLGGGSVIEGSVLMQMASALDISDRVSVIGRVDDDDLPALYAEARAFVYPSEHEGFGLQVCEALAVGCPVFAADASCLPEIVADGGELFPLSTPNRLAEMLKKLHYDLDYRQSLCRRTRTRSQFFSWRYTAEKTLAVYENLYAEQNKLFLMESTAEARANERGP